MSYQNIPQLRPKMASEPCERSRYCWEQTESDDHQGGNNPRTFVRKLGSKLDESVAANLEKALGAEKNICIDQTLKE